VRGTTYPDEFVGGVGFAEEVDGPACSTECVVAGVIEPRRCFSFDTSISIRLRCSHFLSPTTPEYEKRPEREKDSVVIDLKISDLPQSMDEGTHGCCK
jgi:hypothetical protein